MIDKEKYILKIDMSKKNKGGQSISNDNKVHSINLNDLDVKKFELTSSTGSFKNILNNDNTSSFGLKQSGGKYVKFDKIFSKFVKENYKNYKKGGRTYHGNYNNIGNTLVDSASSYPDLNIQKFTYGQDIEPEHEMIF